MTRNSELPPKDADSRFRFEVTDFERKAWLVQRIGWALMFGMVVAALAGGFGNGPLSAKTAQSGQNQMQVDYESIERVARPTELTWRTTPRDGTVQLELDSTFLAVYSPDAWIPTPERVERLSDRLRVTFSSGATEPITIVLQATPQQMGRFTARSRSSSNGPWTTLTLTVLP
jgi:hypothetical protein